MSMSLKSYGSLKNLTVVALMEIDIDFALSTFFCCINVFVSHKSFSIILFYKKNYYTCTRVTIFIHSGVVHIV